jgi:hypothetical protein
MEKRQINIRLIHDGVQPGVPLDEPMRFGLQDTKGEVHPGFTEPGDARPFDLTLDVRGDEASPPVFSGSFAHGPPSGRFLYLSWKREGEHEHPWCWRIKIPLSGIGWAEIRAAEKPGNCLAANVVADRAGGATQVGRGRYPRQFRPTRLEANTPALAIVSPGAAAHPAT